MGLSMSGQGQDVELRDADDVGEGADRQPSVLDNSDSDDEQMTFQNILAVLVGRQSLGGLR